MIKIGALARVWAMAIDCVLAKPAKFYDKQRTESPFTLFQNLEFPTFHSSFEFWFMLRPKT